IESPIITKKCNVLLNSYIPDNLESCSFIAIVSKRIHNHLPFPSVTTPSNILEQLNEIIKHEDTFNLTQYDTSYIRNIHISDDGKIFIVYMTKQQFIKFQNLKYFEINATFKCVNTTINKNTIKEWEITSYVKSINKIFTNVKTSDAYKHIFYKVFSTIEKDNGKQIEFSYLNSNSNGIGCIIADAHKGQAISLSKFLHERYPSMYIKEHLMHIYKICIVYYHRFVIIRRSYKKSSAIISLKMTLYTKIIKY
ncbi:556_t:CDS:2, partial [Funneliformis geosporum]